MRLFFILVAFVAFLIIYQSAEEAEARMSSARRYKYNNPYSAARKYQIQANERRTRRRHMPDEIHIGPTPRLNILQRLKYIKLLELDREEDDADKESD